MPIRNAAADYVAPATKSDGTDHACGIPMGTRFALEIGDADIETWLASLPSALPPETQRSARTIAYALRDYGWFITDTSGAASFQFEDRATAGAEWSDLGLSEKSVDWKRYPIDLLDGLMSSATIYALVPSDRYPP
jgi:hypothetical protein